MRICAALAGVALLAGCAHDKVNRPSDGMPLRELAGTQWTIADINGVPPRLPHKAEVRFSEDRITGSAGCNGFGGGYTLAGDVMTATQVVSTKMACPAGMDQENAFFALLAAPVTVTQRGDGAMVLGNNAGRVTLTPESPTPSPDRSPSS